MSNKPCGIRVRDCRRAAMPAATRLLLGLFLAQALTACGGGNNEGAVPPPVQSPPPVPLPTVGAFQGRFIGTVKIGDVQYYGDAILTVDGAIRLYVGAGPYEATGVIQQTRPETSEQFVGTLEVNRDQASGSGVIIAQGCAVPHGSAGLCGENATGELSLGNAAGGDLHGEIKVSVNDALSTWTLELSPWIYDYGQPASPHSIARQFTELLAEFSIDGDTTVSIDSAGRLFFQSAHSGCTGNGTVLPHLDGAFNVYDVALTIASCNAPYAYLNGGFEGLASTSPSDYWGYDSLLRIWLSKHAEEPSPAAVVMSGQLFNGGSSWNLSGPQ